MLRFVFGVALSLPVAIFAAMGAMGVSTVWACVAVVAAYVLVANVLRLALYVRNYIVHTEPVADIWYLWLDFPMRLFLNASETSWMSKPTTQPITTPRQSHWLAGYMPDKSSSVSGSPGVYSGHVSAFVLLVTNFVLYVTILLLVSPWTDRHELFPPLGYLLLLMALLNWLLPAAAFFLDRWRLPLPLVLLALWCISSLLFSEASHYYMVQPPALATDATTTTILNANDAAAGGERLTVAAATEAWLKGRGKNGHMS